MAHEFKIARRVEFSETDMAGIVHYSNFFRYMEMAEHAFFRSMGAAIFGNPSCPLGWPRVQAYCEYRRPLYFEDEFEIRLLISHKQPELLKYFFCFRKLNCSPQIEVASGALTVVCVINKLGTMTATTIPREIYDKIEVAPTEIIGTLNRRFPAFGSSFG